MLKSVKEKIQQNAKLLADDHQIKQFMNLLRNNNKAFDEIQKALDDFLEKKRENFQRFFFLSNDELLEILSTVKAPIHLQPHLRKVFENLVKLEFDNKESIVAMLSAEGESVPIKQCNFRGEVEEWLKILEDSMKNSIKSVMRTALLKYENEDTQRGKWVLEYPSQVVITVDAIQWTKNTEDYLQPSIELDIFDWYQQNVDQLDELIKLIRGDLSEVERRTLVALVTQDVHFRDIIENMSGSGVNNVFDFKWVQQLRFYWEEETVMARQVSFTP
jgi:dynein heavy chain